MNKEHNFQLILRVDNKTIATRNEKFVEYNEDVIYSLRLNSLMKSLCEEIATALKDSSIEQAHRLVRMDG